MQMQSFSTFDFTQFSISNGTYYLVSLLDHTKIYGEISTI
jgi:hypothetical protein